MGQLTHGILVHVNVIAVYLLGKDGQWAPENPIISDAILCSHVVTFC